MFTPLLARNGLLDVVVEQLIGFDGYETLFVILAGLIVFRLLPERPVMLVLTRPIIFPIIIALNFDPFWFAMFLALVILITIPQAALHMPRQRF